MVQSNPVSRIFSQQLLGSKNISVTVATLISAKVWFQVDPSPEQDSTVISVKPEDAELLKRIIIIAKDF